MGLADWWYYTGVVTKALVIAGIIAMATLTLILLAPHVQLLKPIAQWFGLVEVEYVNKTVYVNRTVYVPVPVNTTSTLGTAFNAPYGSFTISILPVFMPIGTNAICRADVSHYIIIL